MHRVAILATDGVVAFDLAIPCEVFGRVEVEGGPAYAVTVCAPAAEVQSKAFGIRAPGTLDDLAMAETVIVPGVEDPTAPIADAVIEAIRLAEARGALIASICSGAFILAATGLLDGRRATTHWLGAALLAKLHPRVTVDASVLFIDHGRILTAAGASAGMDLCLHMVRRDHGQAAAAHAARLAVAPLEREGGQAQFIRHQPPGSAASLAPLLAFMAENAARPLTLDDLARQATMSSRTLSRRFREQTGVTPLQWLLTARVRNAQHLLETTGLGVEEIAARVGFDSAATLRERFGRMVGVSPAAYRRTFAVSPRLVASSEPPGLSSRGRADATAASVAA